jgi:hypothetical protein
MTAPPIMGWQPNDFASRGRCFGSPRTHHKRTLEDDDAVQNNHVPRDKRRRTHLGLSPTFATLSLAPTTSTSSHAVDEVEMAAATGATSSGTRTPRKDVVYVDSLDDTDEEEDGDEASSATDKAFGILHPQLRQRLKSLGRIDNDNGPPLPLYKHVTPPASEGVAERGLVLYRPLFPPTAASTDRGGQEGEREQATSREESHFSGSGTDAMDVDE